MDIQTKFCERKRPDNWLLLAAFLVGECQGIRMVFIGGSFPNPPDISLPKLGPEAKMNFQNKGFFSERVVSIFTCKEWRIFSTSSLYLKHLRTKLVVSAG